MDFLGRAYILDHCVEEWRREMENRSYQIYVTDSLRTISENTAKTVRGSYLKDRWADIVVPKPKDKRSGEQIAADVIKNAGLKLLSRS